MGCTLSSERLEQLEQQLVDLQTRQAFQDDLLDALNDLVARQSEQLDRHQQQLRRLQEISAGRDELPAAGLSGEQSLLDLLQEERPPHY